MVVETGRPIAQVARELGINEGTLGNWCAKARREREHGDGALSETERAELARLRPNDAVLSEEGRDDPARLTADRVWIIDPLDGTREYGMPGRPDWAVHVALWERGDELYRYCVERLDSAQGKIDELGVRIQESRR